MRFWNRHPWLIAAAAAATAWGVAWQVHRAPPPPPAELSAFDADDGSAFVPGTEALAADEMRVTALGTGMPTPYPSDASSSWLVELGNGEIFLFDIGSGSSMNFNALRLAHTSIKGIFLTHLHADHVGAFVPFWISGWMGGGRYEPMPVWGPSGSEPELGTRHFVEHQIASMAWDTASRAGAVPSAGGTADIHEFDFANVQTVYEQNGVKVTAFPQPHGIDGAVGYRLDWNGRSFVYGGDAAPNRWFVEQARGADVIVHEAVVDFATTSAGAGTLGVDVESLAQRILSLHTQPRAVGRVFDLTRPRVAIVDHFYNLPEFESRLQERVSEIYDGRVVYARDLTVLNVTADNIRVRQGALPKLPPRPDERPPLPEHTHQAEHAETPKTSEWLLRGLLDLGDDNFPEFGGPTGPLMKKIMADAAEAMPPGVDPAQLARPPAE